MPTSPVALANDKYRSQLRSTFIDGIDDSLEVTAVPLNVPTIVVVGWNTEFETVFLVTNKTGDSAANYALTGIEKLRGYEGNLAEGLSVNCLNNEEYFNQWGDLIAEVQEIAEDAEEIVQGGFTTVTDAGTMTLDLGDGANRRFILTPEGDRTLAVSNEREGQPFYVEVHMDGTARDLTWWDGITWIGIEDDPDTSGLIEANKIGSFMFICTGEGAYTGYFLGVEE